MRRGLVSELRFYSPILTPATAMLSVTIRMCSYHGHCTHNDASCQAQHPNSPGPSNAAATGARRCYFCPMRVHRTDQWDRPCPHCRQIRMHRTTACPYRNPTMPDSSSVTDAIRNMWSMDLAKKNLHLPWVLLNEPFEVEALTAADVISQISQQMATPSITIWINWHQQLRASTTTLINCPPQLHASLTQLHEPEQAEKPLDH
uniref:Uncharacterized protein n=1 Tax=Romanomermis culicivorax TaxID=13658 RepID=A0A915J7N8_ROMCU